MSCRPCLEKSGAATDHNSSRIILLDSPESDADVKNMLFKYVDDESV